MHFFVAKSLSIAVMTYSYVYHRVIVYFAVYGVTFLCNYLGLLCLDDVIERRRLRFMDRLREIEHFDLFCNQ